MSNLWQVAVPIWLFKILELTHTTQRKGKPPVELWSELLYANSARGRFESQVS